MAEIPNNDLRMFFDGQEALVKQLAELGEHNRVNIRYVDFVTEDIIISIEGTDQSFDGIMQAINFCRMTDRMLIKSVDFDTGEIKIKWLQDPLSKIWACGLTEEEVTFLQKNKKIMAIKKVRERTGCGLADAKRLVEKAAEDLLIEGVLK